jgi:rubrerythrin
MKPEQAIAPFILNAILRHPRGRSFFLAQAADAEGSDEGRIFDELLTHIDDPELGRLVKRHQADEARHAELFATAAAAQGVALKPIPDELKLLERMDRKLGGFFDQFHRGQRSVMEVYLLLQVIEERALTQFRTMEPVLRKYDPASADIVKEVIADEERHLKYCRAVARRYAPSDAGLTRVLNEMRELEAISFGEHMRANLRYSLANQLVQAGPGLKLIFRLLLHMGERRHVKVFTPFHGELSAA